MEDYNETSETPEPEHTSFGKELAQNVVLSAATSAAVMAGFLAVPLAAEKCKDLWTAHKAKKSAKKSRKTD